MRSENFLNVGDNIRMARKSLGITQKEMAARLGVYQKDVSRWENGVLLPTLEVFRSICEVLGVSADELLELKK